MQRSTVKIIQIALVIVLSSILVGLLGLYIYLGMQQAKMTAETTVEPANTLPSNPVPPIDMTVRRQKITEALLRQNDEVRGAVTTSVTASTSAAILDSLGNQPTDLVRSAPSQQEIIDALHNQ